MITEEELKTELIAVKGKRKDNRADLINNFSLRFISFCKQNKKISFPRAELNFFTDALNFKDRGKQNLVKQILEVLKSKKLIQENSVFTAIYTFRNKPLVSFDYGSYALLMKHNGYKKDLYKYEKQIGTFPIKRKIGSCEIDEKINPEFLEYADAVESHSRKGRNNQAVYSNGNLSVVKDFCFFSESKVYTIL